MTPANPVTLPLRTYKAAHLRLEVDGKVATLTLDRPEKKNPLTFQSYAEVVGIFRAAAQDQEVKAIVVIGAGGNFSSGGDVFEIIAPLIEMKTTELLAFTKMTGDVVKAMRTCPQPIIAAIDGVCAGAGAIVAMASDLRVGTPNAKVLPMPVRAWPITSSPASASGRVSSCIAKGRSMPFSANARTISSRTPS